MSLLSLLFDTVGKDRIPWIIKDPETPEENNYVTYESVVPSADFKIIISRKKGDDDLVHGIVLSTPGNKCHFKFSSRPIQGDRSIKLYSLHFLIKLFDSIETSYKVQNASNMQSACVLKVKQESET